MKIVGIILGKKTQRANVAQGLRLRAADRLHADRRQRLARFFTSRVFGTFMDEGLQLLSGRHEPVAIERAAWKWACRWPAGGARRGVDGAVAQGLSQHRKLDERPGVKSSGIGAHNTATQVISTAMCELKRGGRRYGGGFYEYGADGGKKLWSGLSRFTLRDAQVSMADARTAALPPGHRNVALPG